MRSLLALAVACLGFCPLASHAGVVGYNFTITTAYAAGDPFPNRLDHAFTRPETGYLEITNTGQTSFLGTVGTIAVSSFAGDLSFTSSPLVLAAAASVSIAIPDNSANVGGFNGPYYDYRPGVEVVLNGSVSDGTASESVNLLVADRDIHSGVPRTDQYHLTSDSFVLQGGDLWGFDTGAVFGLSQTDGVYVFDEVIPEPGSLAMLAMAVCAVTALTARRTGPRNRLRRHGPARRPA